MILALNTRGIVALLLCKTGSLMLSLDPWSIRNPKPNDQKADCISRALNAGAWANVALQLGVPEGRSMLCI